LAQHYSFLIIPFLVSRLPGYDAAGESWLPYVGGAGESRLHINDDAGESRWHQIRHRKQRRLVLQLTGVIVTGGNISAYNKNLI
jgi:hypothetical protein